MRAMATLTPATAATTIEGLIAESVKERGG
jgi:hypothetical protein